MKNPLFNDQQRLNYERVAKAIRFILDNHQMRPSLDQIAEEVNLSPFHFQRLFKDWVGATPKNFLQFISLGYAKKILKEKSSTLFQTAHLLGLSGSSRLHDLFVKIEAMTPAEYKNGAVDLTIYFNFYDSVFGEILIANTQKGICHVAFVDDMKSTVERFIALYPNAQLIKIITEEHLSVLGYLGKSHDANCLLRLHIAGSSFQLKVWEALLKIPSGYLASYGDLAKSIGNPKASRAVGSAIGSNPVAYLIPCHRVIQASGALGGYMWGSHRKCAMIGWEMAKFENNEEDN